MADEIRAAEHARAKQTAESLRRAELSNQGLTARLDPFVRDFVASARSLGKKPDRAITKSLGISRKGWIIDLTFSDPHSNSDHPRSVRWPLVIFPDGRWHFYSYTGVPGTTWPNYYAQVAESHLPEQAFKISDDAIYKAFINVLTRG
jgi:hypothetical protein